MEKYAELWDEVLNNLRRAFSSTKTDAQIKQMLASLKDKSDYPFDKTEAYTIESNGIIYEVGIRTLDSKHQRSYYLTEAGKNLKY